MCVPCLQLTHIGKEVNGLRKIDGDVGRMAKQLVKTWKLLLVEGGGEGGRGEEGRGEEGRGEEGSRMEGGKVRGEERKKGKHRVREGGRQESVRQLTDSPGVSSPSVPHDHNLIESPATSFLAPPTSSTRCCELLGYHKDDYIMMTSLLCPSSVSSVTGR